ncbi:MAG: hypothetical protein IT428_32455 [Planctomycetaceae bacterium]|nr:hypothetical protein [Planctomycetaceae bacterium]
MAISSQMTVAGAFADHTAAMRAVDHLERAGFRKDLIGLITRDGRRLRPEQVEGAETDETKAGEGAAAGAAAGAGLGALAGWGIVSGLFPPIGPALAVGTLGVILANAAGGAAVAGLAGALIGMGMPEHEAREFEDEVRSGKIVVTVRANDRAEDALKILVADGARTTGALVRNNP